MRSLLIYLLILPVSWASLPRLRKLAPKDTVLLSQADFEEGTYRIQSPGKYMLAEDIEFAPQEENDYWPPFALWHKYPPAAYYLGFFAAITIEADDVELDLGGFEIKQGSDFYLAQRFFNAIELNDRVFVQNNGVSSLNYQKTDEPVAGFVAGEIAAPTNVLIKNGKLGRSSHAGIHGNSVTDLRIDNVVIEDFEVAGIACNGCKQVKVTNSVVGPSARQVPALATFSNARFLEFYTKLLIPFGFEHEPDSENLMDLFDETIVFADRPDSPLSLSQIFERLSLAVQLFRGEVDPETEEESALLAEAMHVFGNPTGLADGSVQYGIFFNRRGTPETDENFNGAGRETSDIELKDVKIHGLHSNPVEVAALMTEEGAMMQGPARDLLRVYDATSDDMRSLGASFYEGNFLWDAYFALWQLSNSFYRLRVFDSECGNFGSNASFPMNLKTYASDTELTCAQLGKKSDPLLTGRDVTMLQKRYFGGLQMSQGVFDWATTPGRGLDSILASPPSADVLRSGGRHKLVCDHDTMFHPMHGVVGLKIVEANDVTVRDVEVTDLKNIGDLSTWECRHKWQIQPSGEDIMAMSSALNSEQAAMVRGVEIVRCDDIEFEKVKVTELTSDEGGVLAFDVSGDGNDRTDHADDTGVTFEKVEIESLSGPRGAGAFKSSDMPLSAPKGITIGAPDEIDTSLKNPRVVLNYQAVNAGLAVGYISQEGIDLMLQTTSLDTEQKIRDFRGEILAFFSNHYGARFEEGANDNYGLLESIPVFDEDGIATDSFITGMSTVDNESFKYHGSSLCVSDADGSSSQCTDAIKSPIHDYSFQFIVGPSGYTFHGAFGKDQGQFGAPGAIIACGIYSFEGMNLPGVNEDTNIQVKFFGECPLDFRAIKTGALQALYINCALESDLFGKGVGTGGYLFHFADDGSVVSIGYPTMIFDDFVRDPQPLKGVNTDIQSDLTFENNDVRFSYVADGTFSTLLSGTEAFPFLKAHHYTNEAVLEYFKLRTSLQTEPQMLAFRKQFLNRLHDEFDISIDPDAYDEIPLDGIIDLGGGNHITGYVVNEDANQRVLTKQGATGEPTVALPPASRLHEGGFRLVVGRAGIDTIDGRSPFGTTIQEGIYVLENGSVDVASDVEMPFYSLAPVFLNSWSTSVIYNHVEHPDYGEGRVVTAQPMPLVDASGITLKVSGVLVFGNVV